MTGLESLSAMTFGESSATSEIDTKSQERPRNIPSNPSKKYKDEWIGFEDWLRSP